MPMSLLDSKSPGSGAHRFRCDSVRCCDGSVAGRVWADAAPTTIRARNAAVTTDAVLFMADSSFPCAPLYTGAPCPQEQGGCRQGCVIFGGMRISGRVWHSVVDRKSTRLNSSHLGISYAVF